jgi:hypothetical protein
MPHRFLSFAYIIFVFKNQVKNEEVSKNMPNLAKAQSTARALYEFNFAQHGHILLNCFDFKISQNFYVANPTSMILA